MSNKLATLRAFLKDKHMNGIFVSTHEMITYLTGFDFLAEGEREAFLFITQKKTFVITSQLYKDDVKKYVPDFAVLDFFESGKPFWEFIDDALQKETKEISKLLKKNHVYQLGFESNNITYDEYTKLKKLTTTLVPCTLESLRDIKTVDEIEKIRIACQIGDNAFSYLLKHIKPGITEKEVAFYLDTFVREKGAEPSFKTIVAFGKGASVPHHTLTDTRLQTNDIVLVDFGVKYQTYCSDMSRTFFIGTPPEQQANAYNTVLKSQQEALNILNTPDSPQAKAVDKASREVLEKNHYPSFPHSLGHSIGVKVHDGFAISPYSTFTLQPGMVFSVEPV